MWLMNHIESIYILKPLQSDLQPLCLRPGVRSHSDSVFNEIHLPVHGVSTTHVVDVSLAQFPV